MSFFLFKLKYLPRLRTISRELASPFENYMASFEGPRASFKSFRSRLSRKYPENSEVSGVSPRSFWCAGRTPTWNVPNNLEFDGTSGRTWPRSSGTFRAELSVRRRMKSIPPGDTFPAAAVRSFLPAISSWLYDVRNPHNKYVCATFKSATIREHFSRRFCAAESTWATVDNIYATLHSLSNLLRNFPATPPQHEVVIKFGSRNSKNYKHT